MSHTNDKNFKDATPIHMDDISAILDYLASALGIDLHDKLIGSGGKKEFSGDIDLAVTADELNSIITTNSQNSLFVETKKSSVLMTKLDVSSLELESTVGPYIQVDFMPGNIDWLKFYYWAPDLGRSKYPGSYRNILLATIALHTNFKEGELGQERYKLSPSIGLVRVIRSSMIGHDGKLLSGTHDTIIGSPWTDPADIIHELGIASIGDLYSFESLAATVDIRNSKYDIMSSFNQNQLIQKTGIPDEFRQ